tara:strand:+ start:121 stop:1455 length:1335 start_codon:yes stop_codon:yes gene_type:complete
MAKKRSPSITGTTMTAMQELASAWIFKRAIQDNQRFLRAEDIKTGNPKDGGKTYDELLKIWQSTSKGKIKTREMAEIHLEENQWLENFYKQSGRLLREVGDSKFTVFTRGRTAGYTSDWYKNTTTFMEWVEQQVKDRFNIQRKDNWNPADVWLIKDQRKHRRAIMNAMKTPVKSKTKGVVTANLNQFNDLFRDLFKKKQIMGISLKKISGTDAKWKEVNVTEDYFKSIEATEMEFTGAKCKFGPGVVTEAQEERGRRKLDLPTKSGKFSLETQETMVTLKDPETNAQFEIQIKANDNSKFDNLKYEPKDKSNSAARLGKATTGYVDDLMYAYGRPQWKRSWKSYPDSKTDFNETEQNKYLGMIRELKADGVDIGNVTPEEAIVNIRETFDRTSQPQTANSKLMQVTWLYNVLSMSTKNRNKFLTDLIFLAEKSGRRYGPYGKLY